MTVEIFLGRTGLQTGAQRAVYNVAYLITQHFQSRVTSVIIENRSNYCQNIYTLLANANYATSHLLRCKVVTFIKRRINVDVTSWRLHNVLLCTLIWSLFTMHCRK